MCYGEVAYEGSGAKFHAFLTSALDGGEQWVQFTNRFTQWKNFPHPLHRTLGGNHGQFRSSDDEKIPALLRINPR
jgi:hypothetical protein